MVARYAEVIAAGEDEVVIPAVVRMEVLQGLFERVIKAANRQELMAAFQFLERTEYSLGAYRVLPITYFAGEHFDRLKGNKKNAKIGRKDLLIACIALAHDATLVTRNVKDFKPIPHLRVENWAD